MSRRSTSLQIGRRRLLQELRVRSHVHFDRERSIRRTLEQHFWRLSFGVGEELHPSFLPLAFCGDIRIVLRLMARRALELVRNGYDNREAFSDFIHQLRDAHLFLELGRNKCFVEE